MRLDFNWRKRGDSLRDIIPLRLLSLYSSYTSLIFIISLSLSLAKKHIYMMKGKTEIQPFPASGSPTAGFSLPLKCERRQQVAAYSSSELPPIKKDTQGVYIKGIQPFPASGNFINCSEGIRSATFFPLRLLSLYSSYTSLIFIISLSLSRRGCKQPFHRLFGRLVLIGNPGIVLRADFQPVRIPFRQRQNKTNRQIFACSFCLAER